MQVRLALASPDLSAEALQQLTLDVRRTLVSETEILAAVPDAAPRAGERGDAVTLGTLVLTFMTSGAAVALCEIAKAYFHRNSSLAMEFERGDGRTLKISAENLRADQVDKTIATAKRFFTD
jgi:hypothetical protein